MGWENENVFPLLIITAGGGFTGLFVYSPGPGSGNLTASIAAQAGTDPYGNAYVAGITSYGPGSIGIQAVDSASGVLSFLNSLTEAGPYTQLATVGLKLFTGSSASITTLDINSLGGFFVLDNNSGGGIAVMAPTGNAANDTSFLSNALSAGLTPWLLPGTFNINCGNAALNALGPGQYIIGSGDLNTIINAHGSGDLFRWVNTGAISDGTTTGGGFIGGGTIDG